MNSFQTLNRYPHLSAWSQCTQSKAAGSNPLRPLVWSVMGGGMQARDVSLEVAVWSLWSAVLSHGESSYQSISAKHKVSSASWPENINIDLNTLFSLCFQLVALQKAISSCPSIQLIFHHCVSCTRGHRCAGANPSCLLSVIALPDWTWFSSSCFVVNTVTKQNRIFKKKKNTGTSFFFNTFFKNCTYTCHN